MSDEFYRPTLTFPAPGAYNATQVRLYGIFPRHNMGIVFNSESQLLRSQSGGVDLIIGIKPGDNSGDNDLTEKDLASLKAAGYGGKDDDMTVFKRLVENNATFPIGKPLALVTQVAIATKKMGTVALTASISLKEAIASNKIISAGIVVGYAFEGHTYDLPKPKVMIIPTLPEPTIPADDSGFKQKEPHDYAVWIVDKLDECIEFEMNQGFVEQLVLEANLPGKRAPNMYAGRMMMGHRSGRLSE